MSLIQEALEKAGRLPDYKSETLAALSPEPARARFQKEKIQEILKFLKVLPGTEIFRRAAFAALLLCLLAGVSKLFVFFQEKSARNFSKAAPGARLSLPVSQVVHKTGFRLTGITHSAGGGPLALINNQVVGVGERLKENAVVKEIQRQSVTLEFRGSTVKLTL